MAIKSIPRKVFGSSRPPVKFTGENDVIFSVSNFSCALRNTRKLFRGLYGTVFGPEKFSGLMRNARLGLYNFVRGFGWTYKQRDLYPGEL